MADLRVGVSTRWPRSTASLRESVVRMDELGFDRYNIADHIGMGDPFALLGAAAQLTSRMQLATYVINLGFWNPLVLARSAATVAMLSDGRFVLGVGAGHAEVEFRAAGIEYRPPRERVAEMASVVDVLRRLLDGETVSDDALGMHDAATHLDAPPVPLLIGGNGNRVLDLAGEHAEIAGIVGFTSGTGQTHSDLSHWTRDGMRERMARVRAAAARHGRTVEFDVLVQQVTVTDDREAAVAEFVQETDLPADAHLDSPFLLIGTEDEIAEQLRRLSADGVSGITVFEPFAEALAPILTSVRAG